MLADPLYCPNFSVILRGIKQQMGIKDKPHIPIKDSMIENTNKKYRALEENNVSKIVQNIQQQQISVDLTRNEISTLV